MFDRDAWKLDHADLVTEIRRLKKLRPKEIYALFAAKRYATRLYIVRATARGRVHPCRVLAPGSWEEKQQLKAYEELRLKYTKPDPEVAGEKSTSEVETRSAV